MLSVNHLCNRLPLYLVCMWKLHYKESWVLKNWCFWTVVLEKTLESPLDWLQGYPICPSWRKSVLNIHWKGLMLKLKQYLGHLMQRSNSLEKTLMLGEGDNRGWDCWMAPLMWWVWVWVGSRSCWWTGKPGTVQCMGSQRVRHDWATELNWYLVWAFM